MKKLGLAMIALLLMAAGGMILVHLRPCGSAVMFRMEAPANRPFQRMVRSVPHTEGAVDVNRASADELDALPGVGPSIAQRIIDERDQNGPFHYPEDLLSVHGIGQKTLEKLRDQILLP